MGRKKISNLNEEFDLKLFAIIARKNFYLLFINITIFLTLSYLYLRYTHPVYISETVLKIGTVNNANAVLNLQNNQFMDAMGSSNQLAGDIELLRSRVMIARVIARMQMNVSYFSQGNVLDNEMYNNSPFSIEYQVQDSSLLDSRFILYFDSQKQFKVSYNWDDQEVSRTGAIGEWNAYPGIRLKVKIINYPIILRQQKKISDAPYYFTINNNESLIEKYFQFVSVLLLNPNAQTIKISFKDNNASKAADFVNRMAEEYDEYDKERKSEGSNKSLGFINETIQSIDNELKISELSLELFKKENKILDPAKNADDVLMHIHTMIDQRVNIQLEMAVLERLEKDILTNDKLENLLPLLAGTYTDALIQNLVEKIQLLEDRKSNLGFMATEDNAAMKSLDLDIDNQRRILIKSMSNAKLSLVEKIKSIDQRITEFEYGFMKLPGKEAEMSRLQRTYEVNQKFYQLLLEKKVEFSITKAGVVTNNIILQKGKIANEPLTPNRRLIIAGSLLLGFIISFLIIFVRYLFYNEITSLDEINQYTDASLLGIIPKYKSEIPVSRLLVDKNPKSAISESFRSVRT
ncbi:MAG: hypothetical protein KA281_01895, partial [Bacteroidia bacterium]|nr:hypothetical protein [Bacteroidia bacterium]